MLIKPLQLVIRFVTFALRKLQVQRLRTRPRFVLILSVSLFLMWTVIGITSCRGTIVHSPATVNVSGYSRSDGTVVRSYVRRASGVAIEDRRASDGKGWLRCLIGGGWLAGCLVIGLFYSSATKPPDAA